MDKDQKALITLGRLMSQCAGLEFYINLLIEQTFTSTTLIDKSQRESLETRWKIVRETITDSRQKLSVAEQEAIATIDAAIEFYKRSVKDKRDIVAHSPLIKYGDGIPSIVQSRRYKEKGFNKLTTQDIDKVLPQLQKHVAALHNAVSKLKFDPWLKTPYRTVE
jgi:hypothetical protein